MAQFQYAIAIVLMFFVIDSEAIINGLPVKENKYPFLANIIIENEAVEKALPNLTNLITYPAICGGAIISDQWVLTAAHCIISTSAKIGEIFVSVGAHDISDDKECLQVIKVSKIVKLGEFNQLTRENDAILLKLETKLNLSATVQTAQISTSFEFSRNLNNMTVAGWGTTFNNKSYEGISKTPLKMYVLVQDWYECSRKYVNDKQYPYKLPESALCAGDNLKESATCDYDGGDPLFFEVNGKAQIAGVASFPSPDCLAYSDYITFTNVVSLRKNISEAMKSD